jgi:hypothetical protein
MSGAFSHCTMYSTNIYTENLDLDNVTDLSYLFYQSSNNVLNLVKNDLKT